MTSSDLFAFGVSNLRLQAQPSQVRKECCCGSPMGLGVCCDGASVTCKEAPADCQPAEIPPFRLSCSEVDRLAALEHEEITESRQHHNTRPNRKTD